MPRGYNRSAELAAVWQEQRGARTVIMGTLSRDGGSSWSPPTQLSSHGGNAGASAGYPRVVVTHAGFRVFWTESMDGKRHEWNSSLLHAGAVTTLADGER